MKAVKNVSRRRFVKIGGGQKEGIDGKTGLPFINEDNADDFDIYE